MFILKIIPKKSVTKNMFVIYLPNYIYLLILFILFNMWDCDK